MSVRRRASLPPGRKRMMTSVAGLLAFGLLFPGGMAVAEPEEQASVDEVVVDASDRTSDTPDSSAAILETNESPTDSDVVSEELRLDDAADSGAIDQSVDNAETSIAEATIDAASTAVSFKDTALKECVAKELGVRADAQITKANLLNLAGLSCGSSGSAKIVNIEPLAYATNLTDLRLNGHQVSDISPLSGLVGLAGLDLGGNRVSNVSALTGLTRLDWLDLSDNQISDISPLSALTGLRSLHLRDNKIQNVSPLSALGSLEHLYLDNNPYICGTTRSAMFPRWQVSPHLPQSTSVGIRLAISRAWQDSTISMC